MRASKLRHLLTIEQVTETQNSYGEPVPSWSELARVYGSLEPLQGRELFSVSMVDNEITSKAVIRYRDDVTPKMRVKFRDEYYQIKVIRNLGTKDRELELLLTTGVRDDR